MKLDRAVLEELMVHPGDKAGLGNRSTSDTRVDWLRKKGRAAREVAQADLQGFVDDLRGSQELLFANGTHAVLIILQAMDAAGKDGTIKHVISGVNPQGCEVHAFKEPSAEELNHDFLWRYGKALPGRGRVGIFNRSYYEEVLVVRVHPDRLALGAGVLSLRPDERFWQDRYDDINAFERHLHRSGTAVVKFFLNVSREEQKRRLLQRLEDPTKNWKFSFGDLTERSHWDEYQAAYEDALSATSTPWAPWYVVPADHKYAMRALVGGVVVHTVDHLRLRLPEVAPDQAADLARAKAQLLSE